MKNYDVVEKLSILRRGDSFRDWHSLDDRRVCAVCNGNFAGRDVIVSKNGDYYELHCPTAGCRSHAHQWIPDNPSATERVDADWWTALSHPVECRAYAL